MPEIDWTPITPETLPPAGREVLVGWYSTHSKPPGKWFGFTAVYLDGTDPDLVDGDTDEPLAAGWYTENECRCYDSFYLRCSVSISHWVFKPTGPQGPAIDMPAEQPAQP